MSNKTMRKKYTCALVMLSLALGSLCGMTDSLAKVKVKKITLNTTSITLKKGQKFRIRLKKITPKNANKALVFKSGNKKIASVSKKGVVKAIKKGKTSIKVTSKNNKKVFKKIKVKVTNKTKSNVSSTNGINTNINNNIINNATSTIIPSSTPYAPSSVKVVPVFNPDYSKLVGRSDLYYDGLITFSPYGMPVANGRFGGPVWEDNDTTLSMQLNHTDTFMYNDASANSTDESGGLGRINIDFGTPVFDDDTLQHLSLYDACLNINSESVDVKVISDTDSDTVYIKVNDRRDEPEDIRVNLNMLRNANVKRGNFNAISSFSSPDDCMSLNQEFSEACDTGITDNDFFCSTSVCVSVKGRDYTVNNPSGNTAGIIIPAEKGEFTVVIGGASSMDSSADTEQTAYDNSVGGSSFEDVYENNCKFWKDFWSKSYVYLPDKPEFEQRRTYYMYLAGISNRGNYPSKYNGGNWIAQGDRRDWGNWYWNWNQDSLYQPLDSANHLELMNPLYTMREHCLKAYKNAARQLWGINSDDAIFIGETSGILGAELLPEDIAEDVRNYLNNTGDMTDRLKQFGNRRNSFLVPWNWKLSDNHVSYVTHTMVATQETAEYFWQKYCYTNDKEWLRDHAYAFIKGAAELYRNYNGFVKEDDGLYHFNRTNLHEHIWGGRDVIDDLSLARGIFAVAVKASAILNVDGDLRTKWQECLDNLAPYPLSSDTDAIGFTASHRSGNVTWAQGLKPASLIRALEGTESPQFKMLEKFDVLNMETRDQKLDNGDFEIALNTFYDSPGYLNQYENGEEDKNGSSRFLEDAAKLGRSEELEVMFFSQYKAFHDTPNLLHDQGDYYSAEGYGTWASAIQQALNQSLAPLPGEDEVIRVFPAWPDSWDARYRLLAKDGFLVSSSMIDGDIQYVEIDSALGGLCRIRNPWNRNVVIYRNGVKSEEVNASLNSLISFNTVKDENIVIVREGTSPDNYRTEL